MNEKEMTFQARYRLPGGEWSSWGHVVNGVKGHEMELRTLGAPLVEQEPIYLAYDQFFCVWAECSKELFDKKKSGKKIVYAALQACAEQCSTCGGSGEIDETLGGEWNSNQHAPCPDCDGPAE